MHERDLPDGCSIHGELSSSRRDRGVAPTPAARSHALISKEKIGRKATAIQPSVLHTNPLHLSKARFIRLCLIVATIDEAPTRIASGQGALSVLIRFQCLLNRSLSTGRHSFVISAFPTTCTNPGATFRVMLVNLGDGGRWRAMRRGGGETFFRRVARKLINEQLIGAQRALLAAGARERCPKRIRVK